MNFYNVKHGVFNALITFLANKTPSSKALPLDPAGATLTTGLFHSHVTTIVATLLFFWESALPALLFALHCLPCAPFRRAL